MKGQGKPPKNDLAHSQDLVGRETFVPITRRGCRTLGGTCGSKMCNDEVVTTGSRAWYIVSHAPRVLAWHVGTLTLTLRLVDSVECEVAQLARSSRR